MKYTPMIEQYLKIKKEALSDIFPDGLQFNSA